ncbi:trigger factor [bacterium]|nr:trigger factor [bacterium]
MKVNVNQEANNIVKLEIEVPCEQVEKEYDKTIKRISQHANIAGFRKGKAPKAVIERQFGVETVKHETLEALLPVVLNQAIADNNLDVITNPTIDSYEFEAGKDLKLVATVELKPEVTLGDYKNLNVEVEAFKHPDDAFDKSLNSFLERQAELKDVSDRAANGTDLCKIDFDGYLGDEKIENGDGKNYTLDLAHSNFIPGFAEGIVGHNLNEEFDIKVTFPETYHESKLAGQEATFKIKINQIQERVLPELNDEFAKKVGPFNSLEDLKADIQKYLDNTKEREDDALKKKAVFEKVLENVKVDIQETMIERETEELLNEYKQRLASQGFDYDEVMKSQDKDKVIEDIRKDAVLRLKSSLVVDKIAKEENLKIESADVDAKLSQVQAMYNLDKTAMLTQLRSNPAILTNITQQILGEKVIDFLTENNTITLK